MPNHWEQHFGQFSVQWLVSGEKLKLLGKTNVKVTIGGVSEYHLVLVAQHLTQECLLGTDFLSQYAWVCSSSAAACHHSRWEGCTHGGQE